MLFPHSRSDDVSKNIASPWVFRRENTELLLRRQKNVILTYFQKKTYCCGVSKVKMPREKRKILFFLYAHGRRRKKS